MQDSLSLASFPGLIYFTLFLGVGTKSSVCAFHCCTRLHCDQTTHHSYCVFWLCLLTSPLNREEEKSFNPKPIQPSHASVYWFSTSSCFFNVHSAKSFPIFLYWEYGYKVMLGLIIYVDRHWCCTSCMNVEWWNPWMTHCQTTAQDSPSETLMAHQTSHSDRWQHRYVLDPLCNHWCKPCISCCHEVWGICVLTYNSN